MSSLDDVSARLGEYMLQGWVLTDQTCNTPGCAVPLMRSSNGRNPVTFFCANCDAVPGIPRPKQAISASSSSPSTPSDSHVSRPSTPPTDVSSALSSPVFAPPVETEETRRRREQSDTASTEIGKRLLKGWAMLGDECLNTTCYGVPLVRPPKTGRDKDPRKECVICGSIYITESDWAGRERLVLMDTGATTELKPSARSVDGEGNRQEAAHVPKDTSSWRGAIYPPPTDLVPAVGSSPGTTVMVPDASLRALDVSSRALQSTLRALSARLTALSSSQSAVDPASIGSTADAISKVTQALSHVRQLQWNENEAQKL